LFSTTLPLSTRNYLCFLKHSRFRLAYKKPTLCFHRHPSFGRSLLKLLGGFSFPAKVTLCRRLRYRPRVPPTQTPLKRSRQSAVSGRQSAGARRRRAIPNSLSTISLITCPCSSICRILTPVLSTTPRTTLAYLLPCVKRHGVRCPQGRSF